MVPKATDQPAKAAALLLPSRISTPADVGRVLRELDAVSEHLLQWQLRRSGEPVTLPRTSQLLDQAIELNKLNLLQEADRQRLKTFLENVKEQAPTLHFSFGSDPQAAFIERVVSWLRKEVHPQALMSVGLQPTLGAGCMVRSVNRSFDFSLRQEFVKQRPLLVRELAALASKPQTTATPVASETAA
ncbi:MAG TPA: hypothetical protein VG992_02720 [Candidatus Saccharimonadales bacterium]|nr:hypothetical protein [Candidatus Saccharimonadales bacterium]